jgi:hypothetical protein
VEITPERMALIRARVKEWPDFKWRWISVIAHIWHSPFMLGENREGWKATFDWVLKPGVAKRICEDNLDQPNVLKSLRAMDEELLPGIQGSPSPGESQAPDPPEDMLSDEPTPEDSTASTDPPKEKIPSLEERRKSYEKGRDYIREFLDGKRPADPGNGNGEGYWKADSPDDVSEESLPRNQLSEPDDIAEGMDDSTF